MNSTGGFVLCIVQKNGDAVGCRHAETYIRHRCKYAINAVDQHFADLFGQCKELVAYLPEFDTMRLMGNNQAVDIDTEFF